MTKHRIILRDKQSKSIGEAEIDGIKLGSVSVIRVGGKIYLYSGLKAGQFIFKEGGEIVDVTILPPA